jgi:hypothetical protein
MKTAKVSWLELLALGLLLAAVPAVLAQDVIVESTVEEVVLDEEGAAPDVLERAVRLFKKGAAEKTKEESESKEGATEDENDVPVTPAVPVDPDTVTFTLADGSKISGKLTVKEIKLTTSYGTLTIPVARIQSFTPGLGSRPELNARLSGLIEQMGATQYSQREQAEKELISLGAAIRDEIRRHIDENKNADRTKNLRSVLSKIDEAAHDDEETSRRPKVISRNDLVVTPAFTAAGKISPDSFEIASKFGKLNVRLADIQVVERPLQRETELAKTVKVDGGSHITGRGQLNTGIRLNVGDKVRLKAEGQITMTPWGTEYTSGPDGDANQYGWYVSGIPSGCLVGRVGANDKDFKVGSAHNFTAKKAGVLMLAIGINPGQASQAFPGSYNVRIHVDRK